VTLETRYKSALEYAVNTNEFVRLTLKARHDRRTLFEVAALHESSARILSAAEPPEGREDFHRDVIANARDLASMARQRGLYLSAWPTGILTPADLADALAKLSQGIRDRLATLQRH
jgi:hypothetical protein